MKEEWTRVSWREWPLQKATKGGEYLSGGGILLEVAEMAADDPMDVDAVGWKDDKGDPNAVVREERSEGQSSGDASDSSKSPVNYGAGESLVKKESGYFRHFFVKAGIIRTNETEELGEWNSLYKKERVKMYSHGNCGSQWVWWSAYPQKCQGREESEIDQMK
eukprot:g41163.t1